MSQFNFDEFCVAYYTITGKQVFIRGFAPYSPYCKPRIFSTLFEVQKYWERCEKVKFTTGRKTRKLRQIYWHTHKQRILGITK